MAKKIQDYKDYIYITAFVLMLLGYGAKFVLMSDQVSRNTDAIDKAELKVLIYKMEQIEDKVDRLTTLILEQ